MGRVSNREFLTKSKMYRFEKPLFGTSYGKTGTILKEFTLVIRNSDVWCKEYTLVTRNSDI
jgi:hypothetical protein